MVIPAEILFCIGGVQNIKLGFYVAEGGNFYADDIFGGTKAGYLGVVIPEGSIAGGACEGRIAEIKLVLSSEEIEIAFGLRKTEARDQE
jgi:hypothetical protein